MFQIHSFLSRRGDPRDAAVAGSLVGLILIQGPTEYHGCCWWRFLVFPLFGVRRPDVNVSCVVHVLSGLVLSQGYRRKSPQISSSSVGGRYSVGGSSSPLPRVVVVQSLEYIHRAQMYAVRKASRTKQDIALALG
ncbi:hypothetical protein BO85DRAFT_436904 [Aspergillus piperis CBS 112811]|uniref:Uncharacterized protein n=1 Tax=Aspergillus piperis CBS 112811 TaxID=1448313 RepID=A0A8G1R5K8_9EURO|nr:hypothetical protein BO85DRAFT_436904 [Aspergillus piperis CBS 112811]RAH59983.1 hypothetical protein BO85DRAFT_436904 [Aspergillus piperis CBS 112811]